MSRYLTPLLILSLLAAPLGGSLRAADQEEAMLKKLRDTLRNTMLQLRTAQTESAALQATKIENEAKIKDLEDQLKAESAKYAKLLKTSEADKLASDKAIEGLNSKAAVRDQTIAQQTESLGKWKAGYEKVTAIAKTKESERAAAASKVIILERRVEDQQRKNESMFQIGSEILNRYEHFGLGTALASREPFVGLTRVKLQNMFQELGDKLTDAKIKTGDAAKAVDAKPAAPAAEGSAKPAASAEQAAKPAAPAATADAAPKKAKS